MTPVITIVAYNDRPLRNLRAPSAFDPQMSQFENQSWYPEWKKAVDRVVAARRALDATTPETPEGKPPIVNIKPRLRASALLRKSFD